MNKTIANFLTVQERESIQRPIESALTFPARAFFQDDFYQLEIENIYKRRWVAVLFDTDVPNPGDAKAFDLCGMPLVAVRGDDGDVRVFHNICPYDGSLVVIDELRKANHLEVPYHGWIYDLVGKLVEAPYWDGHATGAAGRMERREVDMKPVSCGVFLNTIFINLSDDHKPLDNYLAPLRRALHEYDLESASPAHGTDGKLIVSEGTLKTNWKTFLENACINVLHENFVHEFYAASSQMPRINNDGVPTFSNCIDGDWMALTYDREYFASTYPEAMLKHLGKDEDKEPNIENFGTLYPNFYLSASSRFMEIAYVLPQGATATRQRAIYHVHMADAGRPEKSAEIQEIADIFAAAFAEDGRVTEAVQVGRGSPVYQQKFYSPLWDEMHYHFNQLLLDDLES